MMKNELPNVHHLGTLVEGLAVDSSYVYASLPNTKTIMRIQLPSGTPETIYSEPNTPSGLARSGTDLYWVTSTGELKQAPASGAGPATTVERLLWPLRPFKPFPLSLRA